MIVVTGASGQLGGAIARKLAERLPADQVAVSVRDVGKAAALSALGLRVRKGDFADQASLRQAFEGGSILLMVSSNARAYGADAIAQHRAAIDAAREVGVTRIVYTSHMAASSSSAFPPMLDHAATEQLLAESGLAWTSLRNGFYASSALSLLEEALQTGVLEAPADGKVCWTAHADLAEAAAVIVANGGFDGPTPPLTASRALDLSELARSVSELRGRPIERRVLSDEQMRQKLSARGLPPHVARIALGLYVASRAGEFSAVDSTLEKLIGRAPTQMHDLIAEKLQLNAAPRS